MGDVRETLRSEIESRVDTMGSRNILCDADLDAILATIREVLLSDEAVDATAAALAMRWGELDEYDINPICRKRWRTAARNVLETALGAAGITKGRGGE